MRSKKNIVIVCSLILNVLLIIGFIGFKYYAGILLLQTTVLHYDTMLGQSRHVLSVLDSNDPEKIYQLKRTLGIQIESDAKAAEIWEKVLMKRTGRQSEKEKEEK
jgi:hypothetical protein